jgi:hypothetical protein
MMPGACVYCLDRCTPILFSQTTRTPQTANTYIRRQILPVTTSKQLTSFGCFPHAAWQQVSHTWMAKKQGRTLARRLFIRARTQPQVSQGWGSSGGPGEGSGRREHRQRHCNAGGSGASAYVTAPKGYSGVHKRAHHDMPSHGGDRAGTGPALGAFRDPVACVQPVGTRDC